VTIKKNKLPTVASIIKTTLALTATTKTTKVQTIETALNNMNKKE